MESSHTENEVAPAKIPWNYRRKEGTASERPRGGDGNKLVSEVDKNGLTAVVNGITTILPSVKIFLALSFTLILPVDDAVK
jgi:hypothetical protein